jgi:DNA primase
MNIAPERIKNIASIPAVLIMYGHDPRGRRRIPCPIHGGKNPNFSFNEHAWHCFKCNRGGDAISLVRDLFALPFGDALSKLAADFGVEEERTDAAAKEYAETLKRFNERLAREKRAEREERRAELAERSKLHAVLYRQLLRDPDNKELAAYLNELEFELDFRVQWLKE